MTDSQLFLPVTMSDASPAVDQQRIHRIKRHINQLLTELQLIQSKSNSIDFLQLTINSQLTNLSDRKSRSNDRCPYLSTNLKSEPILNSTTMTQWKKCSTKKTNKKMSLTTKKPIQATSTPKKTSCHSNLIGQPCSTSTPRRSKRPFIVPSTNSIPLKRLLYPKGSLIPDNHHRSQRSSHGILIHPSCSLYPIEECHAQWI